MWTIASARAIDKEELELLLQKGYEPFAVIEDGSWFRIWLKKETHEVPHKPKHSDRGRSSSTDDAAKG